MRATHAAQPRATTPDRSRDSYSRWSTAPAWAGIVGPVLFTATYMAQELARRDEYDPVSETVSALEAGPNGWIQQVNFVVFGVLTLVFASGLHGALRPARARFAGTALLGLSGVALLLAAAFPLSEDSAGNTYDPGGHAVAGTVFFLSSALALLAIARAVRNDSRWQGLGVYTLAAGVAGLTAFFVLGLLVIPETAPLHEWAGLAQRAVILVILFPCRIALGARLLRLTQTGRLERSA